MLEIVDSEVPYRSALEWMYHQQLEAITNADVAAHWLEHYPDEVGTENEKSLMEQAICFFRVLPPQAWGK